MNRMLVLFCNSKRHGLWISSAMDCGFPAPWTVDFQMGEVMYWGRRMLVLFSHWTAPWSVDFHIREIMYWDMRMLLLFSHWTAPWSVDFHIGEIMYWDMRMLVLFLHWPRQGL